MAQNCSYCNNTADSSLAHTLDHRLKFLEQPSRVLGPSMSMISWSCSLLLQRFLSRAIKCDQSIVALSDTFTTNQSLPTRIWARAFSAHQRGLWRRWTFPPRERHCECPYQDFPTKSSCFEPEANKNKTSKFNRIKDEQQQLNQCLTNFSGDAWHSSSAFIHASFIPMCVCM